MSAETEFRALLAGYAPLAALVVARIAQNAVDQSDALPYVVYTATHELEHSTDNTLLATRINFSIECWDETAASADAVADQVQAALLTDGHVCAGRATTFNPETGLDGTVLTVDWWVV